MKRVDTMKKTFIQQLKDWWNRHKGEVKTGIAFGTAFGTLGVAYGMFKGYATADKMWMDHGFEHSVDYSDTTSDESWTADEDCNWKDDPEWSELVNSKKENS